jgi:ribose transport system permease protein
MIKSARISRSWATTVQRYSIIIMLILVATFFALVSKPFLSTSNLTNILLQASATAVAAIGMTFVIVTADIDISTGSLISLAMTVGWLAAVTRGAGAGQEAPVNALIYPVAIIVGLLLGIINGLIINTLKINAFIATLATMNAYRGIAWKLVGSSDKPFTTSPVMFLARTELFGVGLPVFLMIFVAVVAAVALTRTPAGRYLYAMGGSQRSAVETGLPVARMRVIAFAVSGLCAAIAGLVTIGRVGTLQASLGVGFEFTVIAAVVLGGTSLMGGRGTIIGSILGAILLTVIDNGLNLINASVYIYDVVKGVILIVAVVVDVVLTRLGE